jgi:hypothetical protein
MVVAQSLELHAAGKLSNYVAPWGMFTVQRGG